MDPSEYERGAGIFTASNVKFRGGDTWYQE